MPITFTDSFDRPNNVDLENGWASNYYNGTASLCGIVSNTFRFSGYDGGFYEANRDYSEFNVSQAHSFSVLTLEDHAYLRFNFVDEISPLDFQNWVNRSGVTVEVRYGAYTGGGDYDLGWEANGYYLTIYDVLNGVETETNSRFVPVSMVGSGGGHTLSVGYIAAENKVFARIDPSGLTLTATPTHGVYPLNIQLGVDRFESATIILDNYRVTDQLNRTLSYDAVIGTGAPTPQTDNYIYTVQTAPTPPPMHTFIGWNTRLDGMGTTHQPNSTITILADTTLYAQYLLTTTAEWEENRTTEAQNPSVMEMRTADGTVLFDEENIISSNIKESFDPTGTESSLRSVQVKIVMSPDDSWTHATRAEYIEALYTSFAEKITEGMEFFLHVGFDLPTEGRTLLPVGRYVVEGFEFENGQDMFVVNGVSYLSALDVPFVDWNHWHSTSRSLYDLMVDIFTTGGISADHYSIPQIFMSVPCEYAVPEMTCRDALTRACSSVNYHLELDSDGRMYVRKNPVSGSYNYVFVGETVGSFRLVDPSDETPVPFYLYGAGQHNPRYTLTDDLYTSDVTLDSTGSVSTSVGKTWSTAPPSGTIEVVKDVPIRLSETANILTQTLTFNHKPIGSRTISLSPTYGVMEVVSVRQATRATEVVVAFPSTAHPSVATAMLTITGNEMKEVEYTTATYGESNDRGGTLTYTNEVNTGAQLLNETIAAVHITRNTPKVVIEMRDDPALEVGDTVYLEGVPFANEGRFYTLVEADRQFNGSLTATYTFL